MDFRDLREFASPVEFPTLLRRHDRSRDGTFLSTASNPWCVLCHIEQIRKPTNNYTIALRLTASPEVGVQTIAQVVGL